MIEENRIEVTKLSYYGFILFTQRQKGKDVKKFKDNSLLQLEKETQSFLKIWYCFIVNFLSPEIITTELFSLNQNIFCFFSFLENIHQTLILQMIREIQHCIWLPIGMILW